MLIFILFSIKSVLGNKFAEMFIEFVIVLMMVDCDDNKDGDNDGDDDDDEEEEDLGDEGDYDYPENGDDPKRLDDKDEYDSNYRAGRTLFVLRPTWRHCPTRSHK